MKVFTIRVQVGDGIHGSETEHIVVVIVEINGVNIGQVQLAGGDYETAVGIANGLKNLADSGFDLTVMLPEVGKVVSTAKSRNNGNGTTQENQGPQHRVGCPSCGNKDLDSLSMDLEGQLVMCEKCGWRKSNGAH